MFNFGINPSDPPIENNDEEEDEDLVSLTFEEARQLAEAVNESVGWRASIAASGLGDEEYITVQAVFDLFGLTYDIDLESVEEWEYHLKRITTWVNETHPQKGKADDHVL